MYQYWIFVNIPLKDLGLTLLFYCGSITLKIYLQLVNNGQQGTSDDSRYIQVSAIK